MSTTPDLPADRRDWILGATVVVFLLSATSGICDAVDFVRYGVFVANQTGNLVIIFLGLFGEVPESRIPESATSLIAFTLAVLLTVAVRRALSRRGTSDASLRIGALTVEILIILLSAALVVNIVPGEGHVEVIALLALAQGVQAVVLTHAVGVAVSTVVINTALVASVSDFFRQRPRAALVALGTPLGYAAGALIGALAYRSTEWLPLLFAALTTLVSILVLLRLRRQGAEVG